MPVSQSIKDFSTTAGSNSPAGGDAIGTNADNYIRALTAAIRTLQARATIAAASTVDLSSTDNHLVDVSGSGATITTFGSLTDGLDRLVLFQGDNDITHNATSLICPGGMNLKVRSGDLVHVLGLGSGNNRIISVYPKTGGYLANIAMNVLGTSGAVTVDCSKSENHRVSPTGNITFTFSNPYPTGFTTTIAIEVAMGASAYTITWPASVTWPGGTTPTLSGANKTDLFAFYTRDGGTTWRGAQTGRGWTT